MGHRGVDALARKTGIEGLASRLRRRRAMGASLAAAFALVLVAPRSSGDGPRPLAPAEVELPSCRLGRACPDPGPSGWTARIEVLLEARAPEMPETIRRRVAAAVIEETRAAALDPLLVAAMIDVESGFDTGALSWAGARGLMQLLPSTLASAAARNGMAAGDPHDPIVNVRLGIRYYKRLLETFARQDWALMAYNAGPNRIGSFLARGSIPAEFRLYPARVGAEQHRLRQLFGIEAAPVLADARALPVLHPSDR